MKTIPIYKHGEVVAQAQVDDEDYDRMSRGRWKLSGYGYAIRKSTLALDGVRHRLLFMHREVLGLEFGDGVQTDHLNGERLDNRRANLRAVSASEHASRHHADRRAGRELG